MFSLQVCSNNIVFKISSLFRDTGDTDLLADENLT